LVFNELTTESQGACSAGYAAVWINTEYTGPIFRIRNGDTNETLDVYYHDTQYTQLTLWLDGAIPYIAIWYNQVNTAHATQTNNSTQPIFHIATLSVLFIEGRYLNMPDGTVPYGNSDYTFMLKHGEIGNSGGGLVGSGTYGNSRQVNALRRQATTYLNYWWGDDYTFGTYNDDNTVTVTYDGVNRTSYINNILISQIGSTNLNTTNINNTLGVTNTSEYLSGKMYYIFIFSSSLPIEDQTTIYNGF
jgi:hypothetical protein